MITSHGSWDKELSSLNIGMNIKSNIYTGLTRYENTVGELPSKAQRNLKISPFSDPYEWAWSVIESLPLVAIQTFGADLW